LTIRLHDNQGRDWTVEGDWRAHVVGADFDGRGQILVWISPDSNDAHLEPAVKEPDATTPDMEELATGRRLPQLPSGDV
jgi:hypothetical protein